MRGAAFSVRTLLGPPRPVVVAVPGPGRLADDDLVAMLRAAVASVQAADLDAAIVLDLRRAGALSPGAAAQLARSARHTGHAVRLLDRKSTRLNSSHSGESRMPSSA